MEIDANETAQAIKDWFYDSIKNEPTTIRELGQFFFGVSATTIGVLVAFEKLDTSVYVSILLGIALLLLGISLIIALLIVLPAFLNRRKQRDLIKLYSTHVRSNMILSWLWFITWISGVAIGVYNALFK